MSDEMSVNRVRFFRYNGWLYSVNDFAGLYYAIEDTAYEGRIKKQLREDELPSDPEFLVARKKHLAMFPWSESNKAKELKAKKKAKSKSAEMVSVEKVS